jgi:hypothetical protein
MKYTNIPEDTKYRVVEWRTKVVLQEYDTLKEAKKACRAMGYEEGKAPFAFVQCDCYVAEGYDKDYKIIYKRVSDCCIYNPRFS